MKRVVVAIYIDPDYFPPTINAVLNFAEVFEEVIVISRNNAIENYPFPENVHLKKIGNCCSVREMEKQPVYKKLFYFFNFIAAIFKYASVKQCSLLVLYDSFALFAYQQVRQLLRGKKVWYHNHDMVDKSQLSGRSIGGRAARAEQRGLRYIDFFSLPSKERLTYFPSLPKHTPVFIIPNYPSLKVYMEESKNIVNNNVITIIYQGFIGSGHALEELVRLLPVTIKGNSLRLILKGSVTENYRHKIDQLAGGAGVKQQLIWSPIGAYKDVQIVTRSANIGVGINTNIDMVSLTQGTASNKIYEYAACGLPVILFNSSQFKDQLGAYPWSFFTDGSRESIAGCIETIVDNLEERAAEARKSFETGLNFEAVFNPVLQQII